MKRQDWLTRFGGKRLKVLKTENPYPKMRGTKSHQHHLIWKEVAKMDGKFGRDVVDRLEIVERGVQGGPGSPHGWLEVFENAEYIEWESAW